MDIRIDTCEGCDNKNCGLRAINVRCNRHPHVLAELATEAADRCRKEETLIDIAYAVGLARLTPAEDSRSLPPMLMGWADEFNTAHAKTDWDKVDYLLAIDEFVEKKIGIALAEETLIRIDAE